MPPVRFSRIRALELPARLLVIAVLTSILAIVGASALLMRLQASSVATNENGPAFDGGEPLVIAIGRTPGGPSEWAAYAAVFARLQRDLGRRVELRYSLDRESAYDLIIGGEADMALTTVNTYLDLRAMGPVELIAAPVIDGEVTDTAVMVVAAGDPATSLTDLRGSRLAVASGSIAGDVFPQWMFAGLDERPGAFFGALEHTETQDACLELVAGGDAEVTVVRRSDLAAWPDGTFRIIVESPDLGRPPIIAGARLDEATVTRIRASLLAVAGEGVLPSGSSLTGFSDVTDHDYDFSRRLRAFSVESKNGGDA